jgi:hypothetical protein
MAALTRIGRAFVNLLPSDPFHRRAERGVGHDTTPALANRFASLTGGQHE